MTDAKLADELEEHRAIYGDNEPFTLPAKSWETIIAALRKNAAGQTLEGASLQAGDCHPAIPSAPAAPNRIAIGQFILRQSDTHPDKVWIFTSSGEGGIFDAHKLADVIGDFYAENF